MHINFVIPCLLGLERPIADELLVMEAENVQCENGRVLFEGNENMLARANICSRFAERIQVLVGTFSAHSFDELFEGTKALPWEHWVGKTDAFPVKGYSLDSELFSVSDCQSIIKKAVVERLKQTHKLPWFEETGALYQIQFSIMKNQVSLLIDTSGAGLHKRGYRPVANAAPLKETLSAALCQFARLRDFHTLYDPMCGSGTILIEGAMLANNIAPGLHRNFTAELWRQVPPGIWKEERERAKSLEKTETYFRAIGSDIDPKSLAIAKENVKRAGLEHIISFKKRDIADFSPETEKGTVIINPPYGERLLDLDAAHEIYKTMGKVLTAKRGWSYYIITADDDFEKHFGKKADKRRKLYNGMLKCQLYMYFK
ncbi:MAG: class I SAM-dependent RNA methyltransferase [Oscillospiraceae bacterium]|jgi:putative N6-adenine-specific DNA methylase|nr:class I SAM-dependent RNA methyltransferase [Oscillospiraceae bacterium]